MKLSVAEIALTQDKWMLIDLDRRETIKMAVWADDETGEYECLEVDVEGRPIMEGDSFRTSKKTGNILLVKDKN